MTPRKAQKEYPTWLPQLLLAALISVIGWLLADKLDGVEAELEKLGDKFETQAVDLASLRSRVDSIERRVLESKE